MLHAGGDPSTIDGLSFEAMVVDAFKHLSQGTPFENNISGTKPAEFPDVVAGSFGVEIKATSSNHWRSAGNSILETTRKPRIAHIYMFFGKLGGKPDIKYANYEDCLSDVRATHYPRYSIDMNVEKDKTIFKLLNISYDDLRGNESPARLIKRYYKTSKDKNKILWWLDDEEETEEQSAIAKPYIQSWQVLKTENKKEIIGQCFAYFPEVLKGRGHNDKFEAAMLYVIGRHNVVSSSFRDNFSAGGRVKFLYNDDEYDMPKVVMKALEYDNYTNKYLNDARHLTTSYINNYNLTIKTLDEWFMVVDSIVSPQIVGTNKLSYSELLKAYKNNEIFILNTKND